MPNFVLKPGGVHYLSASKLILPDGKPLAEKGRGGGRYRVEPGGVVNAPSLAYFGGAKDRWESTLAAPQVVVNCDVTKIFDPTILQVEKKEMSLPPVTPTKPFLFPTENGLYHVFKSPEERITDLPLSIQDAKSILDALLDEDAPVLMTTEDVDKAENIQAPVRSRRGRPAKSEK